MEQSLKAYPTPKSFRFDKTTTDMLEKLREKLGVSQADIVRLGIRKLFETQFTDLANK